MKYITSFFIIGLLISCENKKSNDDILDLQPKTGREIFYERCIVCHGADGSLGINGAKNLQTTSLNIDSVVYTVNNGRGAMAPFKNILSDEEVDSVANYVMTLNHHKK